MNKVILLGRLVRDPEVSSTPNGISVCRFSIAVQRRYVKAGEERKADFINCVAWRQQAEFIGKYFSKGQRILIEGMLQSRSWEGADGKRQYATEVVVDQVSFVDYKKDQEPSYDTGLDMSDPFADLPEGISPIDSDDDLPF